MSSYEERQHEFRVRMKICGFLSVHPELSPCQANIDMLRKFVTEEGLDPLSSSSWEISLLAKGHLLAVADGSAPLPAPKPPEPPPVLSESDELRETLREHKGDPATVKRIMKAKLKVEDAHAAPQRPAVPAEIDLQAIKTASGSQYRKWVALYGNEAMTARWNEVRTKKENQ
jgi:hypothetical protein